VRTIQKITEAGLILGALVTIPLVVLKDGWAENPLLLVAHWSIWALFTLDLGLGLLYSDERVRHLRTHYIDVAVVVLSFPVFPVMMALTRLIRLSRVPLMTASYNEPESQEIHRKLDRIESALKEIDLALKEDDTHARRAPGSLDAQGHTRILNL